MGKDFVDCGDTCQEDSPEYCGEQERIISRLKKDLEKTFADYVEKGRSDGTIWSKRASYTDITSALNNSYFQNRDPSSFNDQDEIWEEFVKEVWDEDPRLGRNEAHSFNRLTETWVKGFFSGIEEFWAEVRPKIEA